MNKDYKRILMLNPYGIGDVLCTTPILRSLRQKFPNSYIAYMCNFRAEPILRNNKLLNEIIVFDKAKILEIMKHSKIEFIRKTLSYLNLIRKKKFDLVVDLSINAQYGFFMKLANIKNRIGFDYKRRGKFLTEKIVLDSFRHKHIVEHYLGVLELIGIKPEVYSLELFLNKEDITSANRVLEEAWVNEQKDFFVAICPGGGESWGKNAYIKHWPAERFAKIADTIIEKFKAKVIIFAAPEEILIGNKVENLMRNKVINFSGKTDLMEFAALLANCKLLIANDGGPIHIASALGVGTISLFGPVNEIVYGPYPRTEKHIVIKKDITCRPCYQKFKLPPCPIDRECIRSISVEEVEDKAREYFNKVLKIN